LGSGRLLTSAVRRARGHAGLEAGDARQASFPMPGAQPHRCGYQFDTTNEADENRQALDDEPEIDVRSQQGSDATKRLMPLLDCGSPFAFVGHRKQRVSNTGRAHGSSRWSAAPATGQRRSAPEDVADVRLLQKFNDGFW